MGIFARWVEMTHGTGPAMGAVQTPTGPAAPVSEPSGPNIDELQLRSMLQRRLEQFLKELEGYKMPRAKAVQVLASVLQQMQSQFGLSGTHVRQAMRQPQ